MAQNIISLIDLDDENSWCKVLPAAIDHAKHIGARLHVLNIVPDGMFRMSVVAGDVPKDYERRFTDEAKNGWPRWCKSMRSKA